MILISFVSLNLAKEMSLRLIYSSILRLLEFKFNNTFKEKSWKYKERLQ